MKTLILLVVGMLGFGLSAQIGGWNPELEKEAEEALNTMIAESPKLQTFMDQAFGYAIYPKVTKAGVGIGGAVGNGLVYKQGELVGFSKLKQASLGLQLGGQQYSEVIFFKDAEAFQNFTNEKLKFDAQASAVAITEGASIDAPYNDGVAVFTRAKGGLMYEASIGGQQFSYEPVQ